MKTFLDQGQDVPVTRGFGIDDPIRVETCPQQTRREQIATGQAPQDRPFESGGDPGSEQSGAAGKLGGHSSLDHLVQSATWQPTHGKMIIEIGKFECQRLRVPVPAFQSRDPKP